MEALGGATLKAFARLLGLRKLTLGGYAVKTHIGDQGIAVLARSLPRLEILSLDMGLEMMEEEQFPCCCCCCCYDDDNFYEDHALQSTHLTGDSLLAITEHCRELTRLTLPLNLHAFASFKMQPFCIVPRYGDKTLLPPPLLSLNTLKMRFGTGLSISAVFLGLKCSLNAEELETDRDETEHHRA